MTYETRIHNTSPVLTGARRNHDVNKGRTRILVLVAVLALPAALVAEVHCPSGGTPPPGSTVTGGLDVDGTCIVDNITVNGGITVEEGGHLQLTRGTVNGGIVDLPCGELDVNATTNGSGVPTGTISTINGGIDLEAGNGVCTIGGAFSDADIWTAQINGGISITGAYPIAFPFICNNKIKGNIGVDNVTVPLEFYIGDPDRSPDGVHGCTGNVISGAFIMSNSSTFEVESNTIGGSVLLSASTLDLSGNAIGGSLKCSDGTVILPPRTWRSTQHSTRRDPLPLTVASLRLFLAFAGDHYTGRRSPVFARHSPGHPAPERRRSTQRLALFPGRNRSGSGDER